MQSVKLKVLVLDDEPLVADSLAEILNRFDYEAVAIHDPVHAVEWLSSHACDIVIADVVFGNSFSGIDLAIRLQRTLPNCKVLLMSGNSTTSDLLEQAERNGHFFEVIAKPVHPTVILDRMSGLTALSPSDVPPDYVP